MARKTVCLEPLVRTTDNQPSPMSPYELAASVADPVVGLYVDGTIFRTLCEDLDRHLSNVNKHICVDSWKGKGGLKSSPSVRIIKEHLALSGKMLFMLINTG